jgi:hypothetical protein
MRSVRAEEGDGVLIIRQLGALECIPLALCLSCHLPVVHLRTVLKDGSNELAQGI